MCVCEQEREREWGGGGGGRGEREREQERENENEKETMSNGLFPTLQFIQSDSCGTLIGRAELFSLNEI